MSKGMNRMGAIPIFMLEEEAETVLRKNEERLEKARRVKEGKEKKYVVLINNLRM